MLRCRILEPVITAPYRPSASLVPRGRRLYIFARHSNSRAAVLVACVYEYYTVVSVAVPNLLLYVPARSAKMATLFTPRLRVRFLPPAGGTRTARRDG